MDAIGKTAAPKPRFVPIFVIQLLVIMFLVEFVKGALLLTILPVYMQTVLQATAFAIGWTLTAQYIGDNVMRAPTGWAIDRFGYRASMLSGVIVAFVAVALIAMSGKPLWIIVGAALLGLGTAPLWPCVVTGATEKTGDKGNGTSLSVVYVAWLTGAGLGPVVINFFIGATYVPAFRVLIVFMTVVVLVAVFLPGKRALHGQDAGAGERNLPGNPHAAAEPARIGLGHNRVPGAMERIRNYFAEVGASVTVSWLLYPAMFAQTFALGLLSPVLTLYARTVLNLTPQQYSFFLIAGGALTVLGLVPVGKLVDRFGSRPFLWPGFGLGAAVLLVFTYVRSMPMLYLLVAAVGLAFALIIPSWNAFVASAIPAEKRGAVWGFFLTIQGLGMIVGPIVSGKLWDLLGPHAPFLMSGIVLLILTVLQAFIAQPRKAGGSLAP